MYSFNCLHCKNKEKIKKMFKKTQLKFSSYNNAFFEEEKLFCVIIRWMLITVKCIVNALVNALQHILYEYLKL